jgi:pSer/pThr/pTyr-binding forkhead associated (FHA) protein
MKQTVTASPRYLNMNKIIINRGSFRLDEVVFEQGTTTIGRASDNTIALEDTAVSSHHAKIVTLFHTSYIEDLDSTNGTLVNGKSVQKRTLRSGDVVALGNHQLLFQSDNDTQKTSETSETLMLKGSEVKQRLSEFMQAQSQQGKRSPGHPVDANPAIAAENSPDHSSPSKDSNSQQANSAPENKTPPTFGTGSKLNSPSLDREKNQAWLDAKKPPAPAQKPASELKIETATATNSNPSAPAMSVEQTPEQSPENPPAPQALHNTAAAVRASVKTPAAAPASDDSATNTLDSDTPDNGTDDTPTDITTCATINTRTNVATNANDPVISTPPKPTTVDIAAAARAATQRHRNSGYVQNGVMALNRSKPRSKLMPMIWLLIVAVLVAEVVYITYRALG